MKKEHAAAIVITTILCYLVLQKWPRGAGPAPSAPLAPQRSSSTAVSSEAVLPGTPAAELRRDCGEPDAVKRNPNGPEGADAWYYLPSSSQRAKCVGTVMVRNGVVTFAFGQTPDLTVE